MKTNYTVSHFILERLSEIGIKHLFGVPGDYVLDFLDHVIESPIKWVGTCNELNGGYAADGYARLNGASAAVVTYGVGGLSIINAVAGAYAERVPMIVICGAPPAKRRESGALVHHLVDNYQLQLDIFSKVTTDSAILYSGENAPEIIDRVFANCLKNKLPVYLELPADTALTPCLKPTEKLMIETPKSDPVSLNECVAETVAMFNRSDSPLVLAGVELMRHNLGAETLKLIETVEIPFATMLSSKSLLPELHPQFAGIYQGGWSKKHVREQVETSDCIIALGVWMTDLDTGLFSVNLDEKHVISANASEVRIGRHYYPNVQLQDFIQTLIIELAQRTYLASHPAHAFEKPKPFHAKPSKALTATRLYECLDDFLNDDMILLSEPGDAFCASPEFHIDEAENFIVQPYYASIGYTTPASLGVALARPEKRPVVLTGDGALQMTAQEISTLIRQKCAPIIVVINNDGYLIERVLHEDGPYNDIQMWKYSELPNVFSDGKNSLGFRVETEEDLVTALNKAKHEPHKLVLIDALIPGRDCSAGLWRLGDAFMNAKK